MTMHQIYLDNANKVTNFIQEITAIDLDADIRPANSHFTVDAKSIMGLFAMDLTQPMCLMINSFEPSQQTRIQNLIAHFSQKENAC